MKFTIEGKAFQQVLGSVGKVINSKNALTIFDNVLLTLENGMLFLTGSDQENTLTVCTEVASSEGEGKVALNAKTLMEITKETSSQPLQFDVNEDTLAVELRYQNGHFNFTGISGLEYPDTQVKEENPLHELTLPASVVRKGIENTVYAVSQETIRPAMMGIFWDIHKEDITFVSSDTHKLVRYINTEKAPQIEASFIMPAKPANVLVGGLDEDGEVRISIYSKNAVFSYGNKQLVCRFINGNYPPYNRVIPQNSLYTLNVDRTTLLNALKRMALFASKSSSLLRFDLSSGNMRISGSDADYGTSAEENVMCEYAGADMTIGFSATYTIEIAQNMDSETVVMELTDPGRPGIFRPFETKDGESLVTIQMPIQVLD